VGSNPTPSAAEQGFRDAGTAVADRGAGTKRAPILPPRVAPTVWHVAADDPRRLARRSEQGYVHRFEVEIRRNITLDGGGNRAGAVILPVPVGEPRIANA
jgi:hypothetical protein